MNAFSSSASFLNRLGFGNGRGQPGAQASARDLGAIAADARRGLVDDIAAFLLTNDLEISPSNLLTAHGAFSGANPGLARELASRAQAGKAITQSWLDETAASHAGDDVHDGIQLLLEKLEATLEAFSRSSQAARSNTAKYGNELAQHVADLEGVQETGIIMSSLADLTRAMLERTRRVEQEMRRSEDEAKSLRENLEKARHDAEIDHLTGLPNRRAFEALLQTQHVDARAAVDPLCVAFCDIDHFKRINDSHGHEAGDRVIKAVADTLAAITNDTCHAARHGGEEFVMLFRGVTLDEARLRLDMVREQLAARNLVNRKTDAPFGKVTFSAGIADVFAYSGPREALKAADDALYAAKESGRNQVVAAA